LGFDPPSQAIYKPFPGKSGVDTWTYKGVAVPAHAGFDTTIRTASVVIAPAANAPNYTALWWKSPADSERGWGLNLVHQGDVLFATWFTYGATGKGEWLVMSNGAKTAPGSYTGALYRTTGSPYNGAWNPLQLGVTQVGTATFTFTDIANGTFTYSVDGVSGSKAITREAFSSPGTVCN